MTIPIARRPSSYDRSPFVEVQAGDARAWTGQEAYARLAQSLMESSDNADLAVDCYPGVVVDEVVRYLTEAAPSANVVNVESAGLTASELSTKLEHILTDDRVFGYRTVWDICEFYDPAKLESLRRSAESVGRPTIWVGWGASLVAPPGSTVVLADMPRWEIQRRFREGAGNWNADNGDSPQLSKFKRGYFVEWCSADRHKVGLFTSASWILDTTSATHKLITGEVLRAGLLECTKRPFRVVPYFDPGPWGGTWMQDQFALPESDVNYAWCFDCVPEENSLLLRVDGELIEIPSLNVVLQHPDRLLGPEILDRFGADFPIRFDFLDTMNGGNLSLQVHPTNAYIRNTFGMDYTQDESYYILDAGEDSYVYLGVLDGVEKQEMVDALHRAQSDGEIFPAHDYVGVFPAAKHDHFLIPAGTVHASGAGNMVLEISATPYIFTFKLWDWGRVGLDGLPRPIHLNHGIPNIEWDRTANWARENLINRVAQISSGEGWIEETTGLHELEFIETRRHWFSAPVDRDTGNTVNVLNLIEGDRITVESPSHAFAPFEVHFAETFIVPAAVGAYRLKPSGEASAYGVIIASVRGKDC